MDRFTAANATLECPSREVLSEFNRGRLSDADYDAVASHVSSCPRCVIVLEELYDESTHDSLVADLRACFDGRPHPDPLGETVTATGMQGDRRRADEVIGKTIGQYQVLERIGWGGMGVVYRARQARLDRDVALKMILAGEHASPKAIERFHREVQAVARLKSANVVQVHELGEHEGLPYFSMELAEGGSLKDVLQARGPLPPAEAAALVRVLAVAIDSAHHANVLHRDLKPGNILFAADGTPKVADFGLAKLLDEDSSDAERLTPTTDAFLGTPQYMAPEQAAGRTGEVGAGTDVYALGAILYEALTARPPFDAPTKLRTMELVRSVEPERPSRLRAGVPAPLEAICLKCLEKSPARRYDSAGALADGLGSFLRGEPPAGLPGPLARAARRARRHAVALAIGLFSLLVALAVSLTRPERTIERIQRDLARGRTVTLIGATGMPKWSRFLIQDPAIRTALAEDGVVRLVSGGRYKEGLLELLPDPQTERYRFSAEVRHDEDALFAADDDAVGIYVGRTTDHSDREDVHLLVRLSFNGVQNVDANIRARMAAAGRLPHLNIPKQPRPNSVGLFARLIVDQHKDRCLQVPLGGTTGPRFVIPDVEGPGGRLDRGAPGGPDPPESRPTVSDTRRKWHDVELTVTPERISARWDQQPFSLDVAEVQKSIDQGLANLNPIAREKVPRGFAPRFNPRGGLGLYLRQGSASFRNVKVTPLLDLAVKPGGGFPAPR